MNKLIAAGALTLLSLAGMGFASSRSPMSAPREMNGISYATSASAPIQVPGYPFHEYDGRFVFTRIYFEANGGSLANAGRGGRGFGGACGREDCWHHDYPRSDRALTAILAEVTNLRAIVAGEGNVMRLDDPMLMKFPIAYLCEPGAWVPNDKEVAALNAYLAKGGFIIFDDFDSRGWPNFVAQMERVMPGLRPLPLDGSEPVFHTFFDIGPEGLEMQSYRGIPQFFGYFEDNDKRKRQIAIVDFNNDIGEFMEYSGSGFYPVDVSNEAFKIGVDFIIYAVTH